ncbi:MAG: ABC transporter permease [Thermodesulfobacteriota bacterium]
MKYLPLLLVNLGRKKIRSLLTVGSFSIALFLFGLLGVIDTAFYQGVEVAGADRLIVRNKTSLIMPLPISYKQRLLQAEGVQDVTFASWFGGVYQDPKNFFPQFAVDAETYRAMYPEFIIPDHQWKAFVGDRQGCIVGRKTFERFGWKIGDRIPIQASIYRGVWDFTIQGVYDAKRQADDTTQLWFHYEYLNERTPFQKDFVGWYAVRVLDPDKATETAKALDGLFANSSFETTSETEKAFLAGFAKQFGNIKLIILSVGVVVLFTLLLVTGSNMSLSVRERTGEIAILKTIGFGPGKILALVLAESTAYAVLGGAMGLSLCKLFTLLGDPTNGLLPVFYLSGETVARGCGITLLVGLVSGLIPALMAMRLNIVDAMRRV